MVFRNNLFKVNNHLNLYFELFCLEELPTSKMYEMFEIEDLFYI